MSNKFQKKVFNRALKKLRHEMGIELIAALKQKLATSPLVFGNPIVVNQTANTELSLSYDGVECGTYVIDYTSSFIKGNLQVCNDYYDITRMFTNYDTTRCDILLIERRNVYHEGLNQSFVNNIVQDIKAHIIRKYVRDAIAACDMGKARTGSVCVKGDDFTVDIISRIDLSRMDVRYFTIDGHRPENFDTNGCYTTTVRMPIVDLTTVDEIAEQIQVAVDTNQRVFESCYENYDTINDTVGGCIIHLGPYRYLSHRALQPTLNSSFLTFKCPYLNDIITMNIKNQPEIRIERMDDFHMIGHQTILLS